jgi:hypothetical protein
MLVTPQELRERAVSYRLGGPSSEHTALMLDNAAEEIERLERKLGHLVSIINGISRQTAEVVRANS